MMQLMHIEFKTGTVNWLGHLLSDVSGSSGAVGRGTGLCAPFMELLQLCPLSIQTRQDGEIITTKINELAVKMFENGYDFRYSMVQMIPVALNECLINLFWGIRQMLQYNQSITDVLRVYNSSPERHRMLLVGHGTLCVLESGEAVIAGHGDLLEIGLQMNFMTWLRLAFLGFKDVREFWSGSKYDLKQMDHDLSLEWERISF